ncbi:MAG: hypothetical protein FWF24_07615 [Alphaproteobacteria bacterium]|nr:hypothetical protein [Alphaproteobacteria bacterium]
MISEKEKLKQFFKKGTALVDKVAEDPSMKSFHQAVVKGIYERVLGTEKLPSEEYRNAILTAGCRLCGRHPLVVQHSWLVGFVAVALDEWAHEGRGSGRAAPFYAVSVPLGQMFLPLETGKPQKLPLQTICFRFADSKQMLSKERFKIEVSLQEAEILALRMWPGRTRSQLKPTQPQQGSLFPQRGRSAYEL